MKLIDRFLPSYDYRTVHAVSIRCTRQDAFNAIKQLTPAELSRTVWVLLSARGIPARLSRNPYPRIQPSLPIIDQLASAGFLVCDEDGESEIVLGIAGQFWKPHGGIRRVFFAEEFLTSDRLDCSLAALNFVVSEMPEYGSVLVTTETRIYTPDPKARRRFSLYWTFARFGSLHIRRDLLKAIKGRAERTTRWDSMSGTKSADRLFQQVQHSRSSST